MRLNDKVVLITGSTTGIGEAIARRVVAEGGKVLIHGLEREMGQAVVDSLPKDRAALCIEDLQDVTAPTRIVAAAIKAFGKIDGLVNNAALVVRSNIDNTDPGIFDRCMAVNVRAPLLLVQSARPHLAATRGAVINIGSINGYCGERDLLAYSVSKGALLTLSRNLADSLGTSGVRVNLFVMGWVLTENERKLKIAEGEPTDWFEHPDPAFVPSGAMTRPEEIAAAAVYWLSDESRPLSGNTIEMEQYPAIGRNPPKNRRRH